MSVLSRYVSYMVLMSILGVLFVVVSLDVMAAIIDEVGDMRGNYGFFEVLKYVGTSLPGRVYENVPFSALIGCLIGLGILANNSELIVMRGAGISLMQVVNYVLRPVMLVIVLAALLGEYAVPYTDQLAEGRRAILLGRQERVNSVSGVWNREGNEYIHINVAFPNGDLFGLSRYQFDREGQIQEASYSSVAHFTGDGWVEREGVVTRFDGERTTAGTFDSRAWSSDLSPDLLRLVLMEPTSLPMRDLFSYASYLEEQGQRAGNHWLAFWSKVLQPLTTLSLVMIAVSFIFGPLREATTGFRIFAGVVTGIVFSTSQDLMGPASLVYGFSEFWAVLTPILISLLAGLLLLRRAA